jgi:hypothetical protein
MYKLTEKLFNQILEISDFKLGLIDPMGAVGTDREYILEQDYEIEYLNHKPEVEGYWLWRQSDITHGDLPMIEKTHEKDIGKEVIFEDVLVKSPSVAHKKYESFFVDSLEKLLELEPNLRKYIKTD